MSEEESGRKPAGCQGHQKNGTIFPKGALWPWCPCVLAQPASLCSSCSLGQKVKMGKKQRVLFTRDPWLGGQRSLEKWPGLGDSGKVAGACAPGGWGWRCPRRSSAGAQCRAALGTVAHQALVGFEARQGLAAGDGGQGAAEAQHGGRGVLPWGERAGEAKPTGLPVCELGKRGCRRRQWRGSPQVSPPPGNFPHFWSICHFQVNLEKHPAMPCTAPGHCVVIVSLCLCLPLRFILCLFIKHTVSTCSVPSTGDTENGRDTVPALTELTVWGGGGDRHTDNHKHSVAGFHVHSLPCLKEDLKSSSTVWCLERKGRSPGPGEN